MGHVCFTLVSLSSDWKLYLHLTFAKWVFMRKVSFGSQFFAFPAEYMASRRNLWIKPSICFILVFSLYVIHRFMWRVRVWPSKYLKKLTTPKASTMSNSSCCHPMRTRNAFCWRQNDCYPWAFVVRIQEKVSLGSLTFLNNTKILGFIAEFFVIHIFLYKVCLSS